MTQEQFEEKLDELVAERRRMKDAMRSDPARYRNTIASMLDPCDVTPGVGLREVEYAGRGYVRNRCGVCGSQVLDVTHACDGQPRFFCVTCKRPFVIDPPQRA